MANPFLRTTAADDSSTFRPLKSDRLLQVGVVIFDVDGVFTDRKTWADSEICNLILQYATGPRPAGDA